MNRVLKLDLENRLIVVEAGIINLFVSLAVSDKGLFYPPDPSSQSACPIGCNIAHNSGGLPTRKHVVTANHVVGVEMVLPNGEIVELGGKTLDAIGYDLVGLMVGSEGTLGIVTKATLRLTKNTDAVKTILAVYETVEDASNTVSEIIAAGIIPTAVEMADQTAIIAIEKSMHAAGYPQDSAAILLIEVDGVEGDVEAQSEQIIQVCKKNHVREVKVAQSDDERHKLWKGRKGAFAAVGSLRPGHVVQDGVIPRTKLPEVLRKISQISEKYSLLIANVFHAGDGNLHPLILFDPAKGESDKAVQASIETLKICVESGGTITGEHGIGIEKRDQIRLVFNEDDLQAMSKVRDVFNPDGLCNPGKVLPIGSRCIEIAPVQYHRRREKLR